MLIKTSGTCGNPKNIEYSAADYRALIDVASDFISVLGGKSGDILFTYTPESVGHKIVQAYASLTKSKVFLKNEPCDPLYLVGTGPDVFKTLVNNKFKNLEFIIVMRGIVPYLFALQAAKPPEARLYATYGSTELKWACITGHKLLDGYITHGKVLIKDGQIWYNGINSGDYGYLLDNGNLALGIKRELK